MSYFDYFNNDDDDFYEVEQRKIEITLEGKKFKSLRDMRLNATDEDLQKLLKIYDKKIIKSEKAWKLARFGKIACKVLVMVGFGALISSFFTGILKDAMAVCGPAIISVGLISYFFVAKKFDEIECELEDYYDIYDEVDDEIYCREEGQAEDIDYSIQEDAEEIFPDVLQNI